LPDPSAPMLAVYDFENAPTSFDFVNFLARAEIAKRSCGAETISVLFVLNSQGAFWQNENRSVADHGKRVENLLIPLCRLWHMDPKQPPVGRREAGEIVKNWDGPVFPPSYDVESPPPNEYQWAHLVAEHCIGTEMPLWRANDDARRRITDLLSPNERAIAAITLRETLDGRTSDFAAWASLADRLRQQGHRPIFLRDTDFMDTAPPAALVQEEFCDAASRDPLARAAFYELSDICLMHANGPMQMIWLGAATRSMVFGIANQSFAHGCATPIRSMGLNIGSPLAMHSGRHRIIWEDDSDDVLKRHTDVINQALKDREFILEESAPENLLEIARRLRNTYRLDPATRIYNYVGGKNDADSPGGRAGLALCAAKDGSASYILRRIKFARHFTGLSLVRPESCSGEAAAEIAAAHRLAGMTKRSELFATKSIEAPDASAEAKAQALYVLSENRLEAEESRDAENLLCEANALAPYESVYPIALAKLAMRLGDPAKALQWHAVAKSLDPSAPHITTFPT